MPFRIVVASGSYPMLEHVLSYFSSLDLDGTEDPVLLQKPLDRIDGYERQVILNKITCKKLERLLFKCTTGQLILFYRKLDVKELALTKMGSQAIEKIHRNLFRHVYLSNMPSEDAECILGTIMSTVDAHVETLLFDQFGTFVLRPYFELLSGKSTGSGDGSTEVVHRHQKRSIRKFPRHKSFYRALKAHSDLFSANIGRIFATSFASATFAVYLRCTNDRVLITKLVDTHFNSESLRSPIFSYFFEDLAEFAEKDILDAMLVKIGLDIGPLGIADFSNYVIRVLAERCCVQKVYKCIENHLDMYHKNSNVILSLLRSMYRSHEFSLFHSLVHRFYRSLFHSLLLDNGKIVYKYVEIATLIMSLSENHEHVKSLNTDFIHLFDRSWLYEAPGRELTQGFLTGSAAPGKKRSFIAGLYKEYDRLVRSYYGKKLLVTMSRYSDNDGRIKITALLKKHTRLAKDRRDPKPL